MTTTINLPLRGMPGGLIAQASPLPSGWERGVEFLSRACLEPERAGPCPVGYEGEESTPEAAQFQAIQLRQGVACSTLSRLNVGGLASEALEISAEYMLGLEMMDGAASGTNPSFTDATLVAVNCATVAEAIGCLEAAGAVALKGRLLNIHIPPGLSVHMPSTVRWDGNGYVTPFGSRVIISSGYSGSSIFATAEIFAGVNIYQTEEAVARATNLDTGWASAAGLVCFDPCWIGEAETTIECDAGSPGEEDR